MNRTPKVASYLALASINMEHAFKLYRPDIITGWPVKKFEAILKGQSGIEKSVLDAARIRVVGLCKNIAEIQVAAEWSTAQICEDYDRAHGKLCVTSKLLAMEVILYTAMHAEVTVVEVLEYIYHNPVALVTFTPDFKGLREALEHVSMYDILADRKNYGHWYQLEQEELYRVRGVK